MAQKTVLSLIALPTGPARTFLAKTAASPEQATALHGTLVVVPAFVCTLVTVPAYTAELRVTNVPA